MRDSQRVFINTIAQYTRTVINALLSLYTVRIVLSALGESDYGIYTLIAGVVAMLGFITNSLISSTQRFISFYQGKGNMIKLREVFNNSLVIHILLGIVIALMLECSASFLFNGFLNIPANRTESALIVYQVVVAMLLVTFIAAPYTALLISHENIVYISIIEVIDGILKVILVIYMAHNGTDKLVFYSFVMLGIQVFRFLAIFFYANIKYDECCFPKFHGLSKDYVKDIMLFAGWRVYGTACTVGRTQGVTIVINRAFGTIANAGWGIGTQISAYTDLLSSAIVNAMAPQIVKAEGRGDRCHSIWLSYVLSKLVFFLMSVIGIPLIFEVSSILALWLVNPPSSAPLFSVMFILALLFDSMTIGLTHINNAIGNIGRYIFILNTPKLLTLFIAWIFVKMGFPMDSVCVIYVSIEGICAFVRIPLIKQQAGISVRVFLKDVVLKELIPVMFCIIVCLICTQLFTFEYRFVMTFSLSAIIYSLCMYFWGLSDRERKVVLELLNTISQKMRK